MRDLNVTAIQAELSWENPEASRSHFDKLLSDARLPTDLVVLCEMFTTGFSMSPEKVAEKFDPVNMVTLNWMRGWSAKLDAVITGSISVEENGKYYNRLLWVRPDGSFSTYDKRHTFTFAGEDQHYERGTKLLVEEWRGWKICPLICYDLRFPVWSRNKMVNNKPLYDVLIYCANWPEVRRAPWNKILPVRAIENQCYVVGVNRVGTDGSNLVYVGESVFIDPRGECLTNTVQGKEEVINANFSFDELSSFREKFPVLNDADSFGLTS